MAPATGIGTRSPPAAAMEWPITIGSAERDRLAALLDPSAASLAWYRVVLRQGWKRQVRRMFVRNGLVLTGIGVACGLAAAFGLMRAMQGLLFEVRPIDPLTYAAVAAVLLVAAIGASYLPARRASAIEPVEALQRD